MGYGLPAAVGAKAARPDATVICIDGDGCFQMTCQELATAALERLPIVVVIINNGWLGMVRQWQELFYAERYAETHLTKQVPDYAQLAEALGGAGFMVDSEDELDVDARGRARLRPHRRRRRPRRSRRELLPDGSRRRGVGRHHRAARRGRRRGERITRDESRCPPHGLGRAREQAGRARARLADVRAARLQHPEPRGRARPSGPTSRGSRCASTAREHSLEQIEKQMHKLVNVLRVVELRPGESVERELALITVGAPPDKRGRADRARRGLRRPRRRHRPRGAHLRDRRPARGARRVRGARPPARRPRARPHRADRPAPARPASSAVERRGRLVSERDPDGRSDQDGRRRSPDRQGRGARLRQPGPRARAQPRRLGRRGRGRPASRTAPRARPPRRPGSPCATSPRRCKRRAGRRDARPRRPAGGALPRRGRAEPRARARRCSSRTASRSTTAGSTLPDGHRRDHGRAEGPGPHRPPALRGGLRHARR